jgi:CubicO group peptidase (beta-lactamase class C family)
LESSFTTGPASMRSFPAADAVLQQAIQQHAFPGAAYGVLAHGNVLANAAIGRFTYESGAPPVLPETVFDIASITKVVATTTMAMLLLQRGQLDLDQPIAHWLPKFVSAAPAAEAGERRRVTVRMLLAHSSGLPAYARLFEQCPSAESLLDACLHMPLEAPPGTRAVYSDIGFILLGALLERVANEKREANDKLDTFCQREIFTPLGMTHTAFLPSAASKPTIPPTQIPPTQIDDTLRRRILQGEVHDENCWRMGGVSGHAGLFSNVPDLLRFSACMLRGGAPILQPETIRLFTTRDAAIPGSSRALGWDTPSQPSSSGEYFSAHAAGHLGYTGTSLWLDFEKQLAVVLLTNRTFPGNGPGGISKSIQQVRPRFHNALLQSLPPVR